MKYILPVIFRFLGALLYSAMMIVMMFIMQIAYVLWTFKFKFFHDEWFGGQDVWEYDANSSFEKDPKKIYPSIWHWAMESLPKKKVASEIEINKEPFLNNK